MSEEPGGREQGDDGERRRGGGRRGRLAARFEVLLWLGAAALLGSAAWMKADELWYQRRAAAQFSAASAAASARGQLSPPPLARAVVAPGTAIARLDIPRLELTAMVAEGVSDEVLRRAVGHVPESAPIGGAGNVALAGHRDTFFRGLRDIRVGDRIVLESTRGGRTEYRVEWAALVEPRQVDLVADSGYPALTLVTCYPFHYVGNAPYRFVVRARREADAGRAPRAAG